MQHLLFNTKTEFFKLHLLPTIKHRLKELTLKEVVKMYIINDYKLSFNWNDLLQLQFPRSPRYHFM